MAVKGKWAKGIVPRNFAWVLRDQLAVCERPGGYGENHRRVRRQEEIIWIRENEFTKVISLIGSPANLHNYDELGVEWLHRPYPLHDEPTPYLQELWPEIHALIGAGGKVLVHGEELGDRIAGLIGGYLIWAGLLPDGPQAISVVERLLDRQMGPIGRNLVTIALDLRAERGDEA